MMLMAAALERDLKSTHEARMAAGPAVGAREDGGPVQAGKPYVVGERGPELVLASAPQAWAPADPLAGLAAPQPKPQPKGQPRKPTPEEEAEDARIMAEFNQGGGEVIKFGTLSDEEKRKAEEEKRRGEEIRQNDRAIEQARMGLAAIDAREEEMQREPLLARVREWGRELRGPSTKSLQQKAEEDAAYRAKLTQSQREGDEWARKHIPESWLQAIRPAQPSTTYADGSPRFGTREPTSFVRGGDPVADANRAQEGSAYSYKPAFAAQAGQAPGETNIGPMAQTMATDPVASTAVKQDPASGMLMLDKDKLMKLQSAGIGSLQRQVDQLGAMLRRAR
jgi:hypothetical protein